jgi:2-keto-4-pentenoate hydratase
LLSEAKQHQMGIAHPIYGRVYADMILDSPIPLCRFLQPRIEPEVAVVLRSDVPADGAPGTARQAIGGFFLALDVLDSVWRDYRFTVSEVVADNASGGAFALDATPLGDEPPEALHLFANGSLRSEGRTEALGDPGLRLCWLADRVGGLRAGQIVFLGSPAAAVAAEPGVVEVWGGDRVLLAVFERKT